jgi:hypothetical protein
MSPEDTSAFTAKREKLKMEKEGYLVAVVRVRFLTSDFEGFHLKHNGK